MRTIVIIMLVVLPACNQRVSEAGRQSEAAVRALMSAWESGDTAAIGQLFAADAVYDDYPNGTRYKGIPQISAYVSHVHQWASDVHMSVKSVHAAERSAVAEWEMTAVQSAPIGSRVPIATDRHIKLPGVTIVELQNGSIHRAADYIDVGSFVLQLGARIELPGGVILQLPENN